MEKTVVSSSSVLIVWLVVGALVGQSTAQFLPFPICYGICYAPCASRPETTAGYCAIDCLKKCLLQKSTASTIVKDPQSFCKLGCATALCSNFSTKENPSAKKVGSCVDGCSATCAKN